MRAPGQLKPAAFARYPPQARALALAHLRLLQSLPLVFAPSVLREIAGYDWKMPAERRQLTAQLGYAGSLRGAELSHLLAGFQEVRLTASLEETDWVGDPGAFLEQLTAWLWSSRQMDLFKAAAESYAEAMTRAVEAQQPGVPRLGMVVIGGGAARSTMPLFRNLRPHGVYLSSVEPRGGFAVLLATAVQRAAGGAEVRGAQDKHAVDAAKATGEMLHWYIDGGVAAQSSPALTTISYGGLAASREQLLRHTQRAMETGSMGPERLRSMLAHLQPRDLGLPDGPEEATLSHFQVSLLTEGSGTQIFATTFAQWAARECLRRAQPETLLLRFAPRQQAQTMDAMLRGAVLTGLDPAGSLVDADQGAYYTWLNMRRLSCMESLRFLVWLEDQGEAMVVGPGLPGGTTSHTPMDMQGVLKLLA